VSSSSLRFKKKKSVLRHFDGTVYNQTRIIRVYALQFCLLAEKFLWEYLKFTNYAIVFRIQRSLILNMTKHSDTPIDFSGDHFSVEKLPDNEWFLWGYIFRKEKHLSERWKLSSQHTKCKRRVGESRTVKYHPLRQYVFYFPLRFRWNWCLSKRHAEVITVNTTWTTIFVLVIVTQL